MEKTKLLVIAITTAAIITAAITTSLSAATPAFAAVTCDPTSTGFICTGGSGCGGGALDCTNPSAVPGGGGGRSTGDSGQFTFSGGGGQNLGSTVGGSGEHGTCDSSGACTIVGSFPHGIHPK